MKAKSTWDPRANRYERMRAAWVDAMRSGTTKLPFAMFEERMISRDMAHRKDEFMQRRFHPRWNIIENALAIKGQ